MMSSRYVARSTSHKVLSTSTSYRSSARDYKSTKSSYVSTRDCVSAQVLLQRLRAHPHYVGGLFDPDLDLLFAAAASAALLAGGVAFVVLATGLTGGSAWVVVAVSSAAGAALGGGAAGVGYVATVDHFSLQEWASAVGAAALTGAVAGAVGGAFNASGLTAHIEQQLKPLEDFGKLVTRDLVDGINAAAANADPGTKALLTAVGKGAQQGANSLARHAAKSLESGAKKAAEHLVHQLTEHHAANAAGAATVTAGAAIVGRRSDAAGAVKSAAEGFASQASQKIRVELFFASAE